MACDFPKDKNIYFIILINIIKNSRAIIYTDFCHNIAAPFKKRKRKKEKQAFFCRDIIQYFYSLYIHIKTRRNKVQNSKHR